MKTVESVYGKRFFARRNSLNWRVPIMADAVINVFRPQTVIDIGCATGDILRGLQEKGVWVIGIEGSKEAREFMEIDRVVYQDIRKPLECVPRQYDLAMSLEVAEHIEEEYAEQYVKNLCALSNQILLTAAPPGQGGHGHVNCQPKEYWVDKFKEQGFYSCRACMLAFIEKLEPWAKKKGIKAYYDNAMVFEKGIDDGNG